MTMIMMLPTSFFAVLFLVHVLSLLTAPQQQVHAFNVKTVNVQPSWSRSSELNQHQRYQQRRRGKNPSAPSSFSSSRDSNLLTRRFTESNDNDSTEEYSSSSTTGTETSLQSPPPPLPTTVESPVLEQTIPLLLDWIQQYGHPNIPLKNPGGKQCVTLRRLHTQQKLTPAEVDWLTSIGFNWHSLEDVYRYADFDELFERMMAYEASHPDSSFQIPKKCPEDPELGAFVTGIRRLGPQGVRPQDERRLNEVGFVWVSQRQCGSKFMMKYREFVDRANKLEGGVDQLFEEDRDEVISWIQAQQAALKRGALSQTRVHYMGALFGERWTSIGKDLDGIAS